MKLTSPSEVKHILASLGIEPRRTQGQNFLIDVNIRDRIVDLAQLGPDDVVLEIGAGLGVLTEALAARAGRVLAVEKDQRLCGFLAERWGSDSRVELIPADFLQLSADELLGRGVTAVVANLPYSVASRILVNLLQTTRPPERMVLTVQLEVAERLRAAARSPARGLLSVWTQAVYRVQCAKQVSATCFYPMPEVQSAIVTMVRRTPPPLEAVDRRLFYEVTKTAFAARRKQLATIVRRTWGFSELAVADAGMELRNLGLDPRARPEDLELEGWLELTRWVGARRQARRVQGDE